MKKKEVGPALDAFRKIKMQKIDDKVFRNHLISVHLSLFKIGKKIDEDVEALHAAHLGSYEEELADLQDLERKMQIATDGAARIELIKEIETHEEAMKAVRGYEKALNKLLAEEVETLAICEEQFLSEYMKQDYDVRVVEALYPLFG